ncbi:hypothetical protein [Bacillus timonensis]|uniref:hypothetical protein n=1 Tax=Bacillus timonensis TaxID=1033734 RepID=UPI000287EA3A|nr:hypothetical protein [Bacillus timonensis]
MRICKKEGCNNEIPSFVIHYGEKIYLSNGGRKYCLSCSPYKARELLGDKFCKNKYCYRLIEKTTEVNGKVIRLKSNRKYCLRCSPYVSRNRSEEEKLQSIEKRKKQRVIATTKRRKKLTMMAIQYKGGKCLRCGYNRCIRALEFHHRDPSKKEFSISNKGLTRSWERIKKELDKCDLLCANCHREVENGILKSSFLLNNKRPQKS